MKNTLILFVLCLGISSSSMAQEIGLRFGDNTAGSLAIDAVMKTGEFQRLHGNISFGNGGVGADALWDVVYRPIGNEDLHWYFGFGPAVFIGSEFDLGAVGEIGLEYQFKDIPLVLGADWRPFLEIIDSTDLYFSSFGVNLRYRF